METRFRKSSKESNPESVKISQPEDEVRILYLSSIFTKPKNCCSIYQQNLICIKHQEKLFCCRIFYTLQKYKRLSINEIFQQNASKFYL